jgi:hypothetical protein
MTTIAMESRRTFLRALFGTAAGGAATAVLSACQVAVGDSASGAWYQRGVIEPAEVVPLRPGVRYANAMPSAVAGVRTLPSAGSIYAH